MKFSRLSDAVLNRNSVWALLLVLIIFLYSGCGGNDAGQVLPNVTGADKVTSFGDLTKVTVKDMVLTDKNADEYYDRLEKILNGEYSSLANAPKKAAGTPYLTNMILSIRTDEVQALAAYDLATKIITTANYSDGTTEIVTPTWMVYSGPNSLVNNIYTAKAAAGQTVFIAYYTRDGVTRFAIFRLTVNSMSLLDLSMAADSVQASGNYDLSSITVYAKSSNGQIKEVTANWSLLSGRGTLNGNVYTAPAMADTAIFLAKYTEAGVVESAQFTLKINGLTAVSLNKTTDEIQLPETYNLDSELIVTAKYSNGSTLEVTHAPGLTWALTSGSGTLAGTVYTPTAKVETAVFTGSYTESGITKTTTFQLKAIGLSSLSLNKTTDEVQSCANYSLADNLILTDKLSNGTTTNRTMDPNTKWTLVSGRGALSGMVYTTPALAETAVIAASYTEAGITKTINFRLRVNALTLLTLSKTTDETVISTPYDIASKLTVFAKFSNGQTKEVATSPNLKWTISFGSGILNGAVYTTPERIETATLVATYTESGIAQSARFSLKVSATAPGTKILLVGLTINKTTDAVQLSAIYDLGSLAPIAAYSDKTTHEVTLSWIVTSGGGSVAGNIFTAPANIGSVRLMGSYTAADGSIKSVYFTINILTSIPGMIGIATDIIAPTGGSLILDNGIKLEISPNSLSDTSSVSLVAFKDTLNSNPNQFFIAVRSSVYIKDATLKIPLNNKDIGVSAIKFMQYDDIQLIRLNGVVDTETQTYNLSFHSPSTSSAPRISRSPGDGTDPVEIGNDTLVVENYLMPVEDYKEILTDKLGIPIKMPYYHQYLETTCWAAATLMFIKGYQNELPEKDSTIYKLLQDMGISKDFLIDFKLRGKQFFGGIRYFCNYQVNGNENIETKISKILNNTKIEKKEWNTPEFCLGYICYKIANGIPVMLFTGNHFLIIVGINKIDIQNFLNSEVIVNSSAYPTKPYPIAQFGLITGHYGNPHLTFTAENLTPGNNLQTIQFDDIKGIKFVKNGSNVANVVWDHSNPDGYKISNPNLTSFDKIDITCQCCNSDTQPVSCLVETKIYPISSTGSKSTTPIYANTAEIILPGNVPFPWNDAANGRVDFPDTIDNSKVAYNDAGNASNFSLDITLYNSDKTKKLDGFNIKYKYERFKISTLSKYDFVGNTIQFTATADGSNHTSDTTWKVINPDNNIAPESRDTFAAGTLKTQGEITDIKEYTISASYLTQTAEVKIKLLPGIIPGKKTFVSNVDQSFQLNLGTKILDDPKTNIIWSGPGVDETGVYSFSAHQSRSDKIKAQLIKGTRLTQDETLEIDLFAQVTMNVFDMSVDPSKKIIDISNVTNLNNKKFPLNLKWDRHEFYSDGTKMPPEDIADKAEWGTEIETLPVVLKQAIYTPSTPGTYVITAKLTNGTKLNSVDEITNDVEITAEVAVVDIKFIDSLPLTARLEPLDAVGKSMNGYRAEKEFSVLVTGANIPIELPQVDPNKGVIELISATEGASLTVTHKFKYIPPTATTPDYFDSDDTIHVNIKSTDLGTVSTSTEITVYRPQQKTITTFYASGLKYSSYQMLSYTDTGFICWHGFYNTWYNDLAHTCQVARNYNRGQYSGIWLSYSADGKLASWFNYTSLTNATFYGYEYIYSSPNNTPITKTYFSTLTRPSIYVGWTWHDSLPTTTPGWAPPPGTLPPAGTVPPQ